MLTEKQKEHMEKQKYRVVGSHSAVKICTWTKKFLKDEGFCYKHKFYGINSHQCLQMSSSLSCANRCLFCWRDYKAPVSKDWKWQIDDPLFIFEKSQEAHHKLLEGIKGFSGVNLEAYGESRKIKHVALSLTGEPITYPKINELVDIFHKNKISTFLVTNAQYPELIKRLNPVTQLYLSISSYDKALLKKLEVPLFSDYWERLQKSLVELSKKKQRTCIRLTMIKDVNMTDTEKYAELVLKGDPDFIEVKAYMLLGASKDRFRIDNMPLHEDIVEFSKELVKFLPDYSVVSEHIPSRVVLLAKNSFKKNGKWFTWIDFDKFFELVNSKKEFSSMDYLRETPEIGISGKGTFRK